MTQIEKERAKAYEKALEKAKVLKECSTNKEVLRYIDDFFPELAESEDERIRKEIIKYLEQTVPHHHRDEVLKSKEWIAWLEKQNYTFEIKEGHWYKCVCDYMLDSSNLMFKNGRLYYCRSDWRLGGEIGERNVKDIGVHGYKSFFRPATNQEIKDWLEKQGEQNPAWNEEDDKMFNNIASHLNATCGGFPEDEKWTNKFLDWLRTIKDRVQQRIV